MRKFYRIFGGLDPLNMLRKLALRLSDRLRSDAVRLYENSSLDDLIKWAEVVSDGGGRR